MSCEFICRRCPESSRLTSSTPFQKAFNELKWFSQRWWFSQKWNSVVKSEMVRLKVKRFGQKWNSLVWITLIIYFLTTPFHITTLNQLYHFLTIYFILQSTTVPFVFSLSHFTVLYFGAWWQQLIILASYSKTVLDSGFQVVDSGFHDYNLGFQVLTYVGLAYMGESIV